MKHANSKLEVTKAKSSSPCKDDADKQAFRVSEARTLMSMSPKPQEAHFINLHSSIVLGTLFELLAYLGNRAQRF